MINKQIKLDPTECNVKKETFKKYEFGSYLIGMICLLIWIICTITACETEPLLSNTYQKPFLLTYTATSLLILMIIPWSIIHKYNDNNKNLSELTKLKNIPQHQINYNTIDKKNNQYQYLPNKIKQLITYITISLLYFFSTYLWWLSLYYTIASVNNTLFQSQCVFVLIFSVFILKKKLNILKKKKKKKKIKKKNPKKKKKNEIFKNKKKKKKKKKKK
eukprot:191158_1